jgi:protein-disulfide isomerase
MTHHAGVNDADPPVAPIPGATDPDPSIEAVTAADAAANADGEPVVAAEPDDTAGGSLPATEAVGPVTVTAGSDAPATGAVGRQNRIALVGTIALVVAVAFGGGFLTGRLSAPAGADQPAASGIGGLEPSASPAPGASGEAGASGTPEADTTPVPGASGVLAGIPQDGPRLGKPDAKVTVEYWADYQCPFCSRFAKEMIPQLLPLIEDGTIALVHRDFVFIGPESIDAALAVRCAGQQGGYWAMHDAVYAAQNGENKGAFAREKLIAIGEGIGLDKDKLTSCMDDHQVLVDALDDTGAGYRTGIESTPTVDVNGHRFVGMPDLKEFTAIAQAAAEGASPEPTQSAAPATNPWSDTRTGGRVAGDPNASVTVQLWMDYQAPDSNVIAATLDAELRTRIAKGALRVELHDLAMLGDESELAGAAVRCVADQGGPAFYLHEILAQAASGEGKGIYVVDNFLRLGAQLGLDVRALDACLASPDVITAVRDETAAGKAMGLDKAPAVIVTAGGTELDRFSGTLDVAKVLKAVDKAP